MKKFRVYVTYKPSVFDPQGDTITDAAKDLGYQTIQASHVGKFFDIEVDDTEGTAAQTVEELAEKLDLPDLSKTIRQYNVVAENGEDTEFEKPSNYLQSIEKGPFYAFELGVGAYCTMGGLRVNRKNQVLNEKGQPITGLYAAGSDASGVLVGDTYGVNVPGSEAGYCIYSGRVAADKIAENL